MRMRVCWLVVLGVVAVAAMAAPEHSHLQRGHENARKYLPARTEKDRAAVRRAVHHYRQAEQLEAAIPGETPLHDTGFFAWANMCSFSSREAAAESGYMCMRASVSPSIRVHALQLRHVVDSDVDAAFRIAERMLRLVFADPDAMLLDSWPPKAVADPCVLRTFALAAVVQMLGKSHPFVVWNTLRNTGSIDVPVDSLCVVPAMRELENMDDNKDKLDVLDQKTLFARLMHRMEQRHGKELWGGRVPETFVLPHDSDALAERAAARPHDWWIAKPNQLAGGRGIVVVQHPSDIPRGLGGKEDYIVQRYISDPYLLHGRKFHIRFYMYVASWSPFTVFMHKRALVKLATSTFALQPGPFDPCVHISNTPACKDSSKGFRLSEAIEDDGNGAVWTTDALKRYMAARGDSYEHVLAQVHELSTKVLVGSLQEVWAAGGPRRPTFVGIDILVDSDLRAHVLEVEKLPGLYSPTSAIDQHVKNDFAVSAWNSMIHAANVTRLNDELRDLRSDILAMGATPQETCENTHAITSMCVEFDEIRRLARALVAVEKTRNMDLLFPTPPTIRAYNKLFPTHRQVQRDLFLYDIAMQGRTLRTVPMTRQQRIESNAHLEELAAQYALMDRVAADVHNSFDARRAALDAEYAERAAELDAEEAALRAKLERARAAQVAEREAALRKLDEQERSESLGEFFRTMHAKRELHVLEQDLQRAGRVLL